MEEQEEDTEENTSKDLEVESSKGVIAARKFKPCTAGISFAVLSDGKNPSVLIKISFAIYESFQPLSPLIRETITQNLGFNITEKAV